MSRSPHDRIEDRLKNGLDAVPERELARVEEKEQLLQQAYVACTNRFHNLPERDQRALRSYLCEHMQQVLLRFDRVSLLLTARHGFKQAASEEESQAIGDTARAEMDRAYEEAVRMFGNREAAEAMLTRKA